jgi:hypothetical protein
MMKRTLAVLAVVAVLGFGAVAFAHGGPGYGGHMGYGPGGYGPGMMGYGPGWGGHMGPGPGGYGRGMMGNGPGYGKDPKFLEETADLRREIHTKRFEYAEALRTGDEKTAETLAGELEELTGKLREAAPRSRGFARGYCW